MVSSIFWIMFITLVFSGLSLLVFLNLKKIFLNSKTKRKSIIALQYFCSGLLFGSFSFYYFFQNSASILFIFGLLLPILFLFNFWFHFGTYVLFFVASTRLLFLPEQTEIQLFIFFHIIFLFSISFNYVLTASEKLTKTAKNFLYIIVLATIFFVYIQLFDSSFFENKAIVNIYSLILLVFIFALNLLYEFIDKIFKKIIFLGQKVEYENGYFINANFANKKILNFIAEKNVTYGYLCLFSLKSTYSIEQKNFLRNENATNYWKSFINVFDKDNCVFFKTQNNTFGFFVPGKIQKLDLQKIYEGNFKQTRDPNDPLFFLQEIIQKINDLEVLMVMDKKIKCKFNYCCSIYGVHSNNIKELISCSEQILNLKEEENQNQIFCFDPNKTYISMNDFAKYDELRNFIDLSKIRVTFTKCKLNDKTVFEPCYFFDNKLYSLENNNKNSLIPSELKEIFSKHLAAISLKKFGELHNDEHSFLALTYPLSSLYLNNDFSRLIRYLWFNKLSKDKIYIMLDMKNQTSINKEISKTILMLQDRKFKIAFKNVGVDQIELCEKLRPSICFFEKIPLHCHDLEKEYYDNLFKMYENIKINIYKPV